MLHQKWKLNMRNGNGKWDMKMKNKHDKSRMRNAKRKMEHDK